MGMGMGVRVMMRRTGRIMIISGSGIGSVGVRVSDGGIVIGVSGLGLVLSGLLEIMRRAGSGNRRNTGSSGRRR